MKSFTKLLLLFLLIWISTSTTYANSPNKDFIKNKLINYLERDEDLNESYRQVLTYQSSGFELIEKIDNHYLFLDMGKNCRIDSKSTKVHELIDTFKTNKKKIDDFLKKKNNEYLNKKFAYYSVEDINALLNGVEDVYSLKIQNIEYIFDHILFKKYDPIKIVNYLNKSFMQMAFADLENPNSKIRKILYDFSLINNFLKDQKKYF